MKDIDSRLFLKATLEVLWDDAKITMEDYQEKDFDNLLERISYKCERLSSTWGDRI